MNDILVRWLKAYDEVQAAKTAKDAAHDLWNELLTPGAATLYTQRQLTLAAHETTFASYSTLLANELRSEQTVLLSLSVDEAEKMLGDLMSRISEKCWCAGWMSGAEESLPHLAAEAIRMNLPQPWGMGELAIHEARQLIALATRLGHWVNLNTGEEGARYIAYTPMSAGEARRYFANDGFSTHSED